MRFPQRGPRPEGVRPGMTVDGRYLLVRGLSRGPVGEVWLADDLELGRDVVLKRLAVDGAAGSDRLWAEARALARFSHPHVVTLYHAVRGRAASWLVMEHVPGGSLEGRPGLSPGVAARIGAQIADALAALHAEGIVHCDIKPGNVVVTGDGTAKLADFGAAYRVGGTATITPNSAVSYTPDYAAPEVVRGRPQPESDVFSLGATVYALVTGEPPRRGGHGPRHAGGHGPGRSGEHGPGRAGKHGPERAGEHGPERADGPEPEREPRRAGERPADRVEAFVSVREAAGGAVTMGADVGPLADVLAAMLRRDPGERPDAAEARRRLEEVADPAGAIPALVRDADDEPEPGRLPALRRLVRGGTGRRRPGWGRPAGVLATALAAVLAVVLWASGGGPAPEPGPGTGVAESGVTESGVTESGVTESGVTESGRPAEGTPSAGSPHRPPAARDVLGDRRTADPCALLRPATLGRFGRTELDRDYGNFDRCDVLVSPPSDTVVDVKVDLDLDPPPEQAKAATTTGIVTVVADPGESHACNRTLVLDGVTDTTITVTAKRDDDGEAALCDIADAATADAVRTLNRGPLARRSPGFPAESLAQQDACTLLDARALEVVPGIDAADPDRGYGGWDCEWESTTSDTRLDLTFDRGEPPDAAGGTSTRLNGRPAYVRPAGEGEETCLVQVVHRTYPDVHGRTAAETLRILVGGSRPTERLCRMATHLADAATARLPRA
ncbi:serine/threonine-protein kinase [Nonomuraea sp. NPDC050202]|uniref:serine/threonine-protein kinase n=1 Tax=Nonomuraea sp. NPDC050202 TaxID=3155035 RepID=UPI0033C5DC02